MSVLHYIKRNILDRRTWLLVSTGNQAFSIAQVVDVLLFPIFAYYINNREPTQAKDYPVKVYGLLLLFKVHSHKGYNKNATILRNYYRYISYIWNTKISHALKKSLTANVASTIRTNSNWQSEWISSIDR